MGRELRRKQAKREGKSLKKEEIIEKSQIKKLISILCILVIIIVLIYLLSALFVTKELDWFNNNEDETVENNVTNSILASSIFKQKEEEYYVYFYDFSDEDSDVSSTISSKLSDAKVYKVDTGSAMNTNYVSENGNKEATSLENLKVVSPTLIKITSEQIVEYYEKDEIINNLK